MEENKEILLSEFGKHLENDEYELKKTSTEMAELLELSQPHYRNIKRGRRPPTIEILQKIAEITRKDFMEVAAYLILVLKDDVKEKRASVIMVNSNRHRKGNIISFLNEEILKEKYPDYSSSRFVDFIKKYMYDIHYKAQLDEISRIEMEETKVMEVLNTNDPAIGVLKEIVKKLYKLDEESLSYINETIDVYLKYMKK